jgi:alpha-glucosidase
MRNHSAIHTRDQECYQFEDPEDFAHVIGVRYRLLPYLYSEYVKAALNDEMYFRPLAFDYPDDPMACDVEDQLMLGEGLMAAPVYVQNAAGRYVYLPEDMLFVKFLPSGEMETQRMEKGVHYIHVELNEVPLFIRKDHFLPLAEAAECVEDLDEDNLTMLGWITKKTEYLLYHDDGYTRNLDVPEHYRLLSMEP